MRRYVLAISIIVIFALSVAQLASAADEIGTTIKLYEEPAEEPILASKTLMLQITFTNPTEDWVSFSSLEYTLKVTHNGKDVLSGATPIHTIPGGFYIPPEDKHTLYIPFDYYNDLSEDERVGSWAVYFTVENREDVRWYQKNLLSQFLFRPNLQTTANPLEFKVIQPTVEVSRGSIQDVIMGFLDPIISNIVIFIALIASLITIAIAIRKLKNWISKKFGKSQR